MDIVLNTNWNWYKLTRLQKTPQLFAFLLVGNLGAVGSQVMGNLKTPTIIVVCMLIFGNPCTWLQLMGFCVSFTGAFLYSK
jgi:hypothetical protein